MTGAGWAGPSMLRLPDPGQKRSRYRYLEELHEGCKVRTKLHSLSDTFKLYAAAL